MAMVKSLIPKDRYSLAAGFMACMILVVGFAYVDYHSRLKTVNESRAAGLGSLSLNGAVFGGLYKRVAQHSYLLKNEGVALDGGVGDASKLDAEDRKIVRKGTLSIIAKDTDTASQSIQDLARNLGGYVVSAERNNADANGAAVAISLRIPAKRLDEAWGTIRQAAVKVETETMDTGDVTKQYIDLEATLRNYRAEEAQYLLIMKQAKSVKDTLDVSEHLSTVRGNIEKTQGEFQYLQHDIEMSQINVQIRAQAVERVMGIEWRPLYQTKVAFRDSMQALADYFDSMVAFLLYLPVLIVWGLTIFGVGFLGFRALRYAWLRTVKRPEVAPAQA